MTPIELPPLGRVEVSAESGFCFGVVTAISRAEETLRQTNPQPLYCLGDIVHNKGEVERLEKMGMRTINIEQYRCLSNAQVFFRAHGEPPDSYRYAQEHNIKIIDATCPVVLQLQKRVRQAYLEYHPRGGQIVIFGKPGHAEVNGLVGQTEGKAIVVRHADDLSMIDFSRPVILFSQTTMQLDEFAEMITLIRSRMKPNIDFHSYDTICRQVAKRIPQLRHFAQEHDRIFFVAGRKSSNGQVLFEHCRQANPQSIFISSPSELTPEMIIGYSESIGICGATSTSQWQLQAVADLVQKIQQKRYEDAHANHSR